MHYSYDPSQDYLANFNELCKAFSRQASILDPQGLTEPRTMRYLLLGKREMGAMKAAIVPTESLPTDTKSFPYGCTPFQYDCRLYEVPVETWYEAVREPDLKAALEPHGLSHLAD